MNDYARRVFDFVVEDNDNQPEFQMAVSEILSTLSPVLDAHKEYERMALLERLVTPERIMIFRVPWVADDGQVYVNRGYRVQFNSSIGPFKGGLRFHPSVNLSIMKFLAFEQIFKNSLTGLPMGGAKGGSNFDPKGKSDNEVMRFCQSFMAELYRHIGADTDVPAGDIGVGAREIGYMYGFYRKIVNENTGVLTGRGLSYGGSLARKEATGYGLLFIVDEMLRRNGEDIRGKTAVISGSGNVAIYACEKAQSMGCKVVTMSDSKGYVYDKDGIDIEAVKQIKEVGRGRISEYVNYRPNAEYHEGCNGVWSIKCDIALPCATQNEISLENAHTLKANGCFAVGEGANMPTDLDAVDFFQKNSVLFIPGKAANAGGVATSGLEMAQSSRRTFWTFDAVEERLRGIMNNIFNHLSDAAERYGVEGDYVAGANIAGFEKVADAMIAQGIV